MSELGLGWKIPFVMLSSLMIILFASMLYLTEELTLNKKAADEVFY